MRRGQIWWAGLDEPAGSEPGYRRPVLIVQADGFNLRRIQTVVAVALTSNLRLTSAPGNVRLTAKATGLHRESVANLTQLVTIDKRLLEKQAGRLDSRTMRRINEGIRLVLDL